MTTKTVLQQGRAFKLQKKNRVKDLILGGGGGILPSQSRQNPFRLLFAWKMKRKPFEVVAVSLETALRGQRKVFPQTDFRKRVRPLIGIYSAILICGPLLVY
jgi:hypothetical protein